MILTSEAGYIFGGYAQQPWMHRNTYVSDPSAFLFSIKNPSQLAPVKLKLLPRPGDYALYDVTTLGPVFGGATGYDLCIHSGSNVDYNSYSNLGQTYKLPTGQTSTFFTGSKNFKLAEMEVYKVTK